MNYDCCIICQECNSELLVCPLDNPIESKRNIAYSDLISTAQKFESLDCLTHLHIPKLNFTELLQNKAKWHKSCRQIYKKTNLERAIQREKKVTEKSFKSPVIQRSKRNKQEDNSKYCLFCNETTDKNDHSFMKNALTQDILKKGKALDNQFVLQALGCGGDLVSIEARYHRLCYVTFNRKYEQLMNSNENKNEIDEAIDEQLFSYIQQEIIDGTEIFTLQELAERKQNMLEGDFMEGDFLKTVNRTRLKETILNHFPELKEERGTRNQVFLICSAKSRKIIADGVLTQNEECSILLKASSILRKNVMQHDSPFEFESLFSEDCEAKSVPNNVKYFFRQLLKGPDSEQADENTRSILSVSQICLHNMSCLPKKSKPNLPLMVYMGLKIHLETRSRKLIDLLNHHGMCIPYKSVMGMFSNIAEDMGNRAKDSKVVCPSNLRKGLFTVGAMDNIDHNPTSRSATSSFHGTGISLFQFPTFDNPGIKQEPIKIFKTKKPLNSDVLPTSYTFVPPLYQHLICQPPKSEYIPIKNTPLLVKEIQNESEWTTEICSNIKENTFLTWSAHHATKNRNTNDHIKCIESLLPLFYEKAASSPMVFHGMQILKDSTDFLNPNQIPIMVADQPIYEIIKKIQWTFPEKFCEKKFVVLLGGLHVEMAMWATVGDLLKDSGWSEVLTDAGISRSVAMCNSFLKPSDPTRSRYAHQVTVVVLEYLIKNAHESSHSNLPLSEWISLEEVNNPTMKFWTLIVKYEKLVLLFIRSHRERNFDLMVESLNEFCPLFFSMDHQNYARWVSVFIRDMQCLPEEIKQQFNQGKWTILKSNHRFSSIPIDQAHEQANKRVKGAGGVIGLTEQPQMLQRWAIYAPEVSRIVEEMEMLGNITVDDNEILPHHEESLSSQLRFQSHVCELIDAILKFGNPLEENSEYLLTLNNMECSLSDSIKSLEFVEPKGQDQYAEFRSNAIDSGVVSLKAPIKQNKFKIFQKVTKKSQTTLKTKMKCFKTQADIYGKTFVTADMRGVDLRDFFSYEIVQYPPSLTKNGGLNCTSKSDLLHCLLELMTAESSCDEEFMPEKFDAIINDGGALIHSLPPGEFLKGKTFDEYFQRVFRLRILHDLKKAKRIDIVWDDYHEHSIKSYTRSQRGDGIRQRVASQTILPSNWTQFLADSRNKTELFNLLTTFTQKDMHQPEGKTIYITSGQNVIRVGNGLDMDACNHEEADTRVIVHLFHTLKTSNSVMLYTGDTDVVVILLCNMPKLLHMNPNASIWICFKFPKGNRLISMNQLADVLGESLCKCMALFHAFTGCDSTSSLKYKGKKLCFKVLNRHSSFIQEASVMEPFVIQEKLIHATISFLCQLYSEECQDLSVARMNIFCHKTRDIERIPPTEDAAILHLKRSVYQASIWLSACESQINLPRPTDFGWEISENILSPVWISKPLVSEIFKLDVKCNCVKSKCVACKCIKAKLKCTRLCNCTCFQI